MQKKLLVGLLSLTMGLMFIVYTGLNVYAAETVSPTIDKALKAEIKTSIDKGLKYLKDHQEKNAHPEDGDGSHKKNEDDPSLFRSGPPLPSQIGA